jgi:hypothetical protein
LLDAQPVLHVRHTAHRFSNVFRATLVVAVSDTSDQHYFGVGHYHFDLGSIEHVVIRQAIVYVFLDTLVGPPVVLWTTSAAFLALRVHAPPAFRFFITKP